MKKPHDYAVDGITVDGYILEGFGHSEYMSESAGYTYKFNVNYTFSDGPLKGQKGEKSFTIICDSKDGPSSSLYTFVGKEIVDDVECKLWNYDSSQYVLEFAMDQKLVVHTYTFVIEGMEFTGKLDNDS